MNAFLISIFLLILIGIIVVYLSVKNAHTISEDYDHDEMYHGWNENKKSKEDE
jgi:hypothetical protein